MKLDEVHDNKQLMLLQCISGSNAYGLALPTSDTDIKGVFGIDKAGYYGLHYTPQVANDTNDIVYYELRRFVELLVRNNPNILELLNTPADCVLYRHPVMDEIRPELFLSKLCRESFAGYAQTQIKKARGLNKKIFNPVAKERKTIIDFCYVISGYAAVPLHLWLEKQGYTQEDCGLVCIAHARDTYALFHQSNIATRLQGIYSGEAANDVRLSSIPEGGVPVATMTFNKDGYSAYCKDYREYWEWVEKRNDARYENTLGHGKNYDAKNMMHTFRLLHMAEEIAREGVVNVRRLDREYLLKIRAGEFAYDDLLRMADEKLALIDDLYAKCNLPDEPDEEAANEVLVRMREQLYE
ncbi:MAG: nucleotidyltransferase domain-containing protein [Bacteroidota bacterium]